MASSRNSMATIAMIGVLFMITAFAVNFIGQELTEQVVEQLLYFIILLVVLTIIFYVAGRIVVGKKRALFSDAFLISLLGTVVLNVCIYFFRIEVGLILSLIVWLLLIRHYYETGLLGSIAVGIIAMIVSVIILFIIMAIIFGSSLVLFGWLSLSQFCSHCACA